jgi:hypothetical protein
VLNLVGGRTGYWYMYADATVATPAPSERFSAMLLAPADVRPGSAAALHFGASGYNIWGAGVGADFVNHALGAKKLPYNVSKYTGIRFYAKVGVGAQMTMKMLIPTTYSDADGGKCSGIATTTACSDHLFAQIGSLKTTWGLYYVRFADLRQLGFGLPQTTLDPASVYSILFQFAMTATSNLPADLWIDDLSFTLK